MGEGGWGGGPEDWVVVGEEGEDDAEEEAGCFFFFCCSVSRLFLVEGKEGTYGRRLEMSQRTRCS